MNMMSLLVSAVQKNSNPLFSREDGKNFVDFWFAEYETVNLNFEGVESIGVDFADEVFRVFPLNNHDCHVAISNASENVETLIMDAVARYKAQLK